MMEVTVDEKSSPCDICYTYGRKVFNIGNLRKIFLMLLSDTSITVTEEYLQKMMVCWECKAVMSKIAKFKDTVIQSQLLLIGKTDDDQIQESQIYSNLTTNKINHDLDLVVRYTEDSKCHLIHTSHAVDDVEPKNEIFIDIPISEVFDDDDICPSLPHANEIKIRKDKRVKSKKKTKSEQKGILKQSKSPANETKYKSVVLSEEELHKELEDFAEKLNKSTQIYCPSCLEQFKLKQHLNEHKQLRHTPKPNCVQCDVCHLWLDDDVNLLSTHRREHFVRYKCRYCPFMAKKVTDMSKHYAKVHISAHKCKYCPKVFHNISARRYHHDTVHRDKVQCDICKKFYVTKYGLTLHMRTHNAASLACDICGGIYKGELSLKIHKKNHEYIEPDPAAYCAQCKTQFKNKYLYRIHLKKSLKHVKDTVLKFECPICHKKFTDQLVMKNHYDFVHLHVGDYCKECDKIFQKPYGLKRHVKAVHTSQPKTKRDHICDQCGKAFFTSQSLKEHLEGHRTERARKCDLCNATFKYRSALFNHKRLVHFKYKRVKKINDGDDRNDNLDVQSGTIFINQF